MFHLKNLVSRLVMRSPVLSALHNHHRGFTLIELIIVIAIIAILASVIFVSVDPARRINASRNSSRRTAVSQLLKAIKTYQVDSTGSYLPGNKLRYAGTHIVPPGAGALGYKYAYIIGTSVSCNPYSCPGASTGPVSYTVHTSNCEIADLAQPLSPYIKRIPFDPASGNAGDTKYFINKSQSGVLTIGACVSDGEGPNGTGTAPSIQVGG